jgi:hypothetical protein
MRASANNDNSKRTLPALSFNTKVILDANQLSTEIVSAIDRGEFELVSGLLNQMQSDFRLQKLHSALIDVVNEKIRTDYTFRYKKNLERLQADKEEVILGLSEKLRVKNEACYKIRLSDINFGIEHYKNALKYISIEPNLISEFVELKANLKIKEVRTCTFPTDKLNMA